MFKQLLARAREARAAELEGEGGLEGGFTLIELMVVLLIIAILLAIAIPTFLSVSGGARDRAAQSNATNALTNLIAYYQNSQNFDPSGTSASLAVSMNTSEPSFNWVAGNVACTSGSTNNYQKCVSVQNFDVSSSGDAQAVILAVLSGNSNNCWYIANLQASSAAPVTATDTAMSGTGPYAFQGITSGTTLQQYNGAALTNAGTYYSMQTKSTSCEADTPELATSNWTWYSSYSAAQNNPDA
jgi:prepilin-type N-terminal cleavage/methylation domain-containing protein